jgi:hypothetical protein
MRLLNKPEDLIHFVQREKALVFCSATWVTWLPSYRDELDAAELPVAEVDVDNEMFWDLLRENSVLTVPSFMLYCDGKFKALVAGKVEPDELKGLICRSAT